MGEVSFISLPFQPMKSMKTPFYFSTAIMGEYLASLFDGEYYLGINSLHSFKQYSDEECNEFVEKFDFINRKKIYFDADYIEPIKEIIQKLYVAGDIQIRTESTAVCDCGRAEITESEIKRFNEINMDMQLAGEDEEGLKCRVCGNKLEFKLRKSLFLKIKEEELNEKMNIHPDYLNSDVNHFRKSLQGSFLRISRERNTGVVINLDGQEFNLDIDMLWKFIPICIESSKIIVVSSVKHLFPLYIINYLAKIMDKEVYFVGLPFIQTSEIGEKVMDFYKDNAHRNSLRLLVDLGIGWNKKNIMLQESTCKYFMSSKDKNNELIDFIYKAKVENEDWNLMKKSIISYTHLQRVIGIKKLQNK